MDLPQARRIGAMDGPLGAVCDGDAYRLVCVAKRSGRVTLTFQEEG